MSSAAESRCRQEFIVVPVHARSVLCAVEPSLSGRLITLAEEERKQLAREAHELGQCISQLPVELPKLAVQQQIVDSVRVKLKQPLVAAKEPASDARNFSDRLQSSELQHLGAPLGLKEVCRQIVSQHHISATPY